MMQISHAATGAAVGKFMPNPLLAFVAGILIHFVIDKIPHYWPVTKKGKIIFTVPDYAVTAVILAWFLWTGDIFGNMIYGIAGSAIVDILIIGVPWIFKGPVGKWHTNRQPHQQKLSSLMTDAIITVIGVIIIFYL